MFYLVETKKKCINLSLYHYYIKINFLQLSSFQRQNYLYNITRFNPYTKTFELKGALLR